MASSCTVAKTTYTAYSAIASTVVNLERMECCHATLRSALLHLRAHVSLWLRRPCGATGLCACPLWTVQSKTLSICWERSSVLDRSGMQCYGFQRSARFYHRNDANKGRMDDALWSQRATVWSCKDASGAKVCQCMHLHWMTWLLKM